MTRIHLVGLPHTQFDDKTFSFCAFTAKAVRTARMLRSRGREVTVYWGGSSADVSCLTGEEQAQFFGEWSASELPSIEWDSSLPYWRLFHQRVRDAIDERINDRDIVAFVGGSISHELIDHYRSTHTVVEPGVGYAGISPHTFACFESYAWMHNRYGAYNIGDHRQFDTVIPNAIDPDEWGLAPSQGYALFVGRLIHRKGPHVAAQIANAAGLKLVMAGGGVAHQEPGRVVATDGTVITGDIEHVGGVIGDERRALFAGAEVFICPTLYIGPWEGVHQEACMSGIPTIAPDAGAFVETLPRRHRYRSLADAVSAIKNPHAPRGDWWRQHAIDLCGIERCANLYDDWFDRLESLRDGRNGWYG